MGHHGGYGDGKRADGYRGRRPLDAHYGITYAGFRGRKPVGAYHGGNLDKHHGIKPNTGHRRDKFGQYRDEDGSEDDNNDPDEGHYGGASGGSYGGGNSDGESGGSYGGGNSDGEPGGGHYSGKPDKPKKPRYPDDDDCGNGSNNRALTSEYSFYTTKRRKWNQTVVTERPFPIIFVKDENGPLLSRETN